MERHRLLAILDAHTSGALDIKNYLTHRATDRRTALKGHIVLSYYQHERETLALYRGYAIRGDSGVLLFDRTMGLPPDQKFTQESISLKGEDLLNMSDDQRIEVYNNIMSTVLGEEYTYKKEQPNG